MSYVSVEHRPGVWVDAHIEKQWKREGRWQLSVYYFVDTQQFYRVFDADQVQPATPTELQDGEQSQVATGRVPAHGEHDRREPIDVRRPQRVGPID